MIMVPAKASTIRSMDMVAFLLTKTSRVIVEGRPRPWHPYYLPRGIARLRIAGAPGVADARPRSAVGSTTHAGSAAMRLEFRRAANSRRSDDDSERSVAE